jgi:flagellar basal body-associated protein FliL
MIEWQGIVAIIGSIVVPLVIFMLALMPIVRKIVQVEIGDVREKLAKVEESNNKAWEILPKLIPSVRGHGNPNGRKAELLQALEERRLTYQESTELNSILERELEDAKKRGDQSTMIALGLFIVVLLLAMSTSR